MLEIKTEFTVAKPTKRNWCGVYGYRPEEPGLERLFGEMFAVMSISAEIDFNLTPMGGLLFDELQDAYFRESEPRPATFNDFEKALVKVKKRLEAILEREQDLANTGIDLEMSVVVVKGNVIFGGLVGEARIHIYRAGKAVEVGQSFIDPDMDGFMRSGSLKLEPDDRLLLSTSQAADKLDELADKVMGGFMLANSGIGEGALLLLGYGLVYLPQKKIVNLTPVVSDLQDKDLELEDSSESVPEEAESQLIADPTSELSYEDNFLEEQDEEGEDKESRLVLFQQQAMAVASGLKGRSVSFFDDLRKRIPQRKNLEQMDNGVERYSPSPYKSTAASVSQLAVRINSLRNALSRMKTRGLPRSLPVDLRMMTAGKWKTIIVLVIVLVAVLFLVIRRHNEQVEIERQLQAVQSQIADLAGRWQQLKVEASAVGIGDRSVEEKQSVLVQISAAETEAVSLLEKGVDVQTLEGLQVEMQQAKEGVLNIRSFTEPQIVADLGLIFQGVETAAIAYSGGNIFVADKARGEIYRMNTALGSEAAVFATGLTSPYLLTLDQNGNILVVDQSAESVLLSIDPTSGESRRLPGLSLARMGIFTAADVYDANGALYTANTAKTAIFKQEAGGSTFQLPNDSAPWRSDPDFASIRDLTVDYSIFALVGGRGMLRYEASQPADYVATGFLPEDLTAIANAVAFELTPTKIYIADPLNKRVIVAERTSVTTFTYLEQYKYVGEKENVMSEIKDIVVNEAIGKMFVLDGPRVLRFDI